MSETEKSEDVVNSVKENFSKYKKLGDKSFYLSMKGLGIATLIGASGYLVYKHPPDFFKMSNKEDKIREVSAHHRHIDALKKQLARQNYNDTLTVPYFQDSHSSDLLTMSIRESIENESNSIKNTLAQPDEQLPFGYGYFVLFTTIATTLPFMLYNMKKSEDYMFQQRDLVLQMRENLGVELIECENDQAIQNQLDASRQKASQRVQTLTTT